ncbi:MAG: ATPase, partial [Pseudomonadota bacterium]|nr:ATPase [Pseudomonadota bacterium]
MARYYLGFDVGGSRTRARLIDADGAVVGMGEAGPGNTRMGIERVKQVLLEAGSHAIAAAGIEDVGAIAMGAGIAGLSREGARSV